MCVPSLADGMLSPSSCARPRRDFWRESSRSDGSGGVDITKHAYSKPLATMTTKLVVSVLLWACAACTAVGAVPAPGADESLRTPAVQLQDDDFQSLKFQLDQLLDSNRSTGSNSNCAACDALMADLQELMRARGPLGKLLDDVSSLSGIGPEIPGPDCASVATSKVFSAAMSWHLASDIAV
jgi:hypothetical protein